MLQGFYPGGTAIAFRQMTNWASRQGFTEAVRDQMKASLHGDRAARLTKAQEVASGIIGGMLACWCAPLVPGARRRVISVHAGPAKCACMPLYPAACTDRREPAQESSV